ncbi:hypothetical protein AYI68_g7458, partial [Smittium mucronatum]
MTARSLSYPAYLKQCQGGSFGWYIENFSRRYAA